MSLDTNENVTWMSRALELAQSSVNAGNHPFGALLVADGKIVLEAENTVISEKDPTRHAELNLVSLASKTLPSEILGKATLFTSTEPCAMCSGAIYWVGLKSVVYGCPSKVLEEIAGPSLMCNSHTVFQHAIDPPKVRGPLLESEAIEQHKMYWKRL